MEEEDNNNSGETSTNNNGSLSSTVTTKVLICKENDADKYRAMQRLASWDISDAQVLPRANYSTPSTFLKEIEKSGVQIQTMFLTDKILSRERDLWNFFKAKCIVSNLKELVLTLPELPIEIMAQILQNAPLLEVFHAATTTQGRPIKIGKTFGNFWMLQFCHVLRSHPSLNNFTLHPLVEINHRDENMRDLMGEDSYYRWTSGCDPYSDEELFFNAESVFEALVEAPNLRVVSFCPCFEELGENHEEQLDLDVHVATLAKLCSKPYLSEIEVDFRPVAGGEYTSYGLSVYSASSMLGTVLAESKSLVRFSYRHEARRLTDYEIELEQWDQDEDEVRHFREDEPIVLHVVKSLGGNRRLEKVIVEQRHTEQEPGLVTAMSASLKVNPTLVELRLPYLKLSRGDSNSIIPIVEALKENRTLQVLDIRSANFNEGNNTKVCFKKVLVSDIRQPILDSDNCTLLYLETTDFDDDDSNLEDNGGGDDGDGRKKYTFIDFIHEREVELALLLNRAGRGKLLRDIKNTTTSDLVEVLSKVPDVCRGHQKYNEGFLKSYHYAEARNHIYMYLGGYKDLEYLGRDDDVSWLEDRDAVGVNYYLLRQVPHSWASSRTKTGEPCQPEVSPAKKKTKLSHE